MTSFAESRLAGGSEHVPRMGRLRAYASSM